jgi:hypothetical protein
VEAAAHSLPGCDIILYYGFNVIDGKAFHNTHQLIQRGPCAHLFPFESYHYIISYVSASVETHYVHLFHLTMKAANKVKLQI